jgi:hypothetical protein
MGPDQPQDDWRPGRAAPYWRRRFVVLAGVVGVTGVVVWSCSSAGHGATPGKRQPEASDAAQSVPSGAPALVGTSSPSARPAPTAHPSHQAHPARPARLVGSDCAPRDVVISLHTSQRSYAQPARPRFTIYVVNTAGQACTLDASPQALRLVVRSGAVRSWSPADCAARPTASQAAAAKVQLKRGVPLILHVSWNRVRSLPGCPMPRVGALPGSYTATVSDGPVSSPPDVFTLR